MPADTHVLVLDPERARSRAHDLVAHQRGVPRRELGRGRRRRDRRPIDLGAASYRAIADVREHALDQHKPWWTMSPFGIADDGRRLDRRPAARRAGRGRQRRRRRPRRRRAEPDAAGPPGRRLPRRRGPRARRHQALASTRASGSWWSTPGTARPSAWSRCSASATWPPGWSSPTTSSLDQHVVTVTCGALVPGLRRRDQPAGAAHRRGPLRPEVLDPRHAQDAGAPQAADRPAGAQGRRLRRARAARRRPLRGDEAARGRRRGARVPRPRVRRLQARRPAGPALRPRRRARPGHPLRRRRAAHRWTGSAAPTGPSARAGPARRSARSPPS